MELEKEIIIRYKKKFPHETLKETSERTGIQITRVFRLFSGRKMKVSELEAFQKAIEGSTPSQDNRIQLLIDEILFTLDKPEIEFIHQYLERKLERHHFNRSFARHNSAKELIA